MSNVIRYFYRGWQVGLYILLWLLILAHRIPIIAQSSPLVVTYIDGDTLYAWHTGVVPRTLVKGGNLAHLLIAPDASRVIFLRDNGLWIAGLDPAGNPATILFKPEALDSDPLRQVLDMAWLDSRTVIFNTYRYTPKLLVQQQISDDLWQVDTATGSASRLRIVSRSTAVPPHAPRSSG